MKRLSILGVLIALVVMVAAVPAQGDTVTEHNLVIPIDDPDNPCQPAFGEAIINLLDHFSVAANGSLHGTHTETGNFVLTGPAGVEGATGHYTFWGGFNANPRQFGGWFTLRIKGTNVDGSTFQINMMGQERDGANPFEFFQFNCHDRGRPTRV